MFSKKDIYKITLPLILQQALAVTISMVDSVMVSASGEEAVAGVSLIGILDTVLILMFSSLVTGGTVVITHALGKGDEDKIRDGVKQTLYVSTFTALLVLLISKIFGNVLLQTLYGTAEKAVFENAVVYFQTISYSFPFLAIENSCAAAYRAMGRTKDSLYVSIIQNLINVVFNAIFIFICGLGAQGAALGTLVSRFAGMVIWLFMIHNKRYPAHIDRLFHYRPNWEIIRKILKIGIPGGFENCLFQFGRLLTQSLVSTLGTAAIAANSVALNLANYQYIPGAAIGNAAVSVVGRAVGAKEEALAKKYSRTMLLISYSCLWVVNLASLLLCRPLVGMYQLPKASAEIAEFLLILHSVVGSLIWPIGFFLPHIFRSAGDVKLTAFISPFSVWMFRVLLSYFLALDEVSVFGLSLPGLGWNVYGVWCAMFIDWIFRCSFYLPHYIKDKWLRSIYT
ncbi:MAG: MATE family efflux transporter [Clostridia bacterium]|nr:MATE family efflux transporter [Clostridia bacterium]